MDLACHDSDVGMDYFSFLYCSPFPLFPFHITLCSGYGLTLVLVLNYPLFTHTH